MYQEISGFGSALGQKVLSSPSTHAKRLCEEAGRPGDEKCIAQALKLWATKPDSEIIEDLRSAPGKQWIVIGVVGAVALVGGALWFTRKKSG